LEMVGKAVEGADGSKGLQGELGENRGEWNIERVASEIEFDYKKGQVPYFQYQPSTGEVFYHGYVIWQGQNLKESMVVLKQRLTGGGEEK